MQPLDERIFSLDAFRGLAVMLMIFVNASGIAGGYAWFVHSSWHGSTLADLAFPFFLFAVGFSVGLASDKQKKHGKSNTAIFAHTLHRATVLFLWGLLLNFLMTFDISHLRLLGVLQRIAICYVICSLLHLKLNTKYNALMCVALLVGYWLCLLWIPAPGFEPYTLTPDGNLSGFIDRQLLPGHTDLALYDSEGLLTTLPSLASTLIGLLTYHSFLYWQQPQRRSKYLTSGAILLLAISGCWSFIFPINKILWTSSFVLWTSGVALLSFMVCYFFVDIKKYKRGWVLLITMGQHSLGLYILHIIFLKIQIIIKIPLTSGSLNLKNYLITDLMHALSKQNAALIYALVYTILWMVFSVIYFRRQK